MEIDARGFRSQVQQSIVRRSPNGQMARIGLADARTAAYQLVAGRAVGACRSENGLFNLCHFARLPLVEPG